MKSYKSSIQQATLTDTTTQASSIMPDSSNPSNPPRMPVYFLGIGGPNFMEDTKHPAYAKLAAVGREITTKVKPKAVVVFSAHWQGGPSKIKINTAEHTDLIYDFYGFPPHYYEYDYPNRGSPEVAEKVIEKLAGAGIETERVKRGLDHGVWAGFMVAFDPKNNPLNVPIVQVSLYSNEDPDQHYNIGRALESLRDEGILIIGAGMAVHNLHDFRAIRGTGETMPYVVSFDEALKEAAASKPEVRQTQMSALMRRGDARRAHPTREHILPIHIAAGAAGSDIGERLWTLPEASLSWAQYRFGKVPVV
ncbi:putative aromatic ring-opening dioxygenase LigB subunit [Hypomontagnella submonticulosa]|nr:putative aromatic ring-opening dioxygenase LigB subunit [Hypomontagnella submonticulosa]